MHQLIPTNYEIQPIPVTGRQCVLETCIKIDLSLLFNEFLDICDDFQHENMTVRHCGVEFLRVIIQKSLKTVHHLQSQGRPALLEVYSESDLAHIQQLIKEKILKVVL